MTSDSPRIRPGRLEDVERAAQMLQALVAAGKRTAPADPGFTRSQYFEAGPDQVSITVAATGERIFGLQVLKRGWEGNPYGIPVGWGVIGTHVHPDAAGQGIGRRLFAETFDAARHAGLDRIDAAIMRENAEGQGYYAAMGFARDREDAERVHYVLTLD